MCNSQTNTCVNDNPTKDVCLPYRCSDTSDGCFGACFTNDHCQSPYVCVEKKCASLGTTGAACDEAIDCLSGICNKLICCNSEGNCCKSDAGCPGYACDDLGYGPGIYGQKCLDNACTIDLTQQTLCGGYNCHPSKPFCGEVGKCTADTDCYIAGGYICVSGHCKHPSGVGELCEDGGDCKSPLQCDNNPKICCETGDCCTSSNPHCNGKSFCALGVLYTALCGETNMCTVQGIASGSTCSGYQCANAYACKTSCSSDSDCVGGYYCNGSGKCIPPDTTGGDACTKSSMCISDYCSNGFCCTSGECCKNTSNCSAYNNDYCVGDVHVYTTCDDSVCTKKELFCGDVGNFSCNKGACNTTCTLGSDCQEGYGCNPSSKTCTSEQAAGEPCSGDNACSNFCMGGFCCNGGFTSSGLLINECCDDHADCDYASES
ncbi:MAG TPA: hypothetical protein EYN66_04015, partial [Myxococcales bacterium]|nr:hypothetical protein [Myxococcales bacterium]